MDRTKLVDLVYEAALLPELWPLVLDGVAAAGGSSGATIFTVADRTGRWVSNDAVRDAMNRFVSEGWAARNERMRRTVQVGEPRFVTDLDIFTPAEIDQDPLYRDFLRPAGFGWGAGTLVRAMTDDMIAITVERSYASGPLVAEDVAALDGLRPHLARAALMASRLKLEMARNAVDTLSALRLPGAALSASGRVVVANDAFETLMPKPVVDVTGRLGLAPRSASSTFRALFEGDRSKIPHGSSIPLRFVDHDRVAIVHTLPLVRDARDIFAAATRLVFVTGLGASPGVEPGVLEGLFDLTPAEARVARALAEGTSVAEIARRSGLSPGTVRVQLKAVFRKTDTRRQVDLVRLLGGLGAAVEGGADRVETT